jgi:hypothetical protein
MSAYKPLKIKIEDAGIKIEDAGALGLFYHHV